MECVFLYLMFFLLCSGATVISSPLHDITYGELEELNATCAGVDSCKPDRPWYEDSVSLYSCHCNRFCANLRTCCVDSPFKDIKPSVHVPSCRNAFASYFHLFMVERCPDETDRSVLKEQCENDWEETDGVLSLLPVISLSTNMTYKNIFCFRCNEAHDEYFYWNLELHTNEVFAAKDNNEDVIPTYDSINKTWVAALSEDDSLIPVELETTVPYNMYDKIFGCYYTSVISSCSENWHDDEIRHKCSAYAAFVHFTGKMYKNPHCALCNFEDLSEMSCPEKMRAGFAKKQFSFSLLLDINRSDGDRVGKIELCNDDSIWDPFFKKCRGLKCVLPGHVVKNGKCAP